MTTTYISEKERFGQGGFAPLDFEIRHFFLHFFVEKCFSVIFVLVK